LGGWGKIIVDNVRWQVGCGKMGPDLGDPERSNSQKVQKTKSGCTKRGM